MPGVPPPPPELRVLVDRYHQQRPTYESSAYRETTARREFIEPLFQLLGWDVHNAENHSEAYKDVVYEESLVGDEGSDEPDYTFRVGGLRKFFVEAKRPGIRIREDLASAHQLRRYGWSANLPLCILTNFAEFSVYDTRVQPAPGDLASTARISLYTYLDYESRWDDIAGTFSKSAVWQGAFDSYAQGSRARRGHLPVDDAFLYEMERWREQLASEVARRNATLNAREVSYAVQAIIDRIVFLRICEDRGIERLDTLRDIGTRPAIYVELMRLFQRADARYDSGLFHFTAEHGRLEPPDTLTPALTIRDSVLRQIIERLYFPASPYEFSVLTPDILGNVYEQFLGKLIELDDDRHVTLAYKPELRRAGGVYYTPAHIVRDIVEHTLGPQLDGATVEGMASGAESLRVVDPACGSGSFITGAYQFLLDWYLERYAASPDQWSRGGAAKIFEAAPGRWRLSTAERKRILLSHIYGVDIDYQAVEVTKLSLMLKVLEGESTESIQQQQILFHERALPDLFNNIKCGNSLVGSDLYAAQWTNQLAEAERRAINAFDWETEFPQVFANGGFDCVIGNPPYVYRNATEDRLRAYYRQRYESAQGNYELYKFFAERSLGLLRPGGRLGFIVSASFLIQPSFSNLRRVILESGHIERLAPLGPGAFKRVAVDTTIIVVRTGLRDPDARIEVRAPSAPTQLLQASAYSIPQSRFEVAPEYPFNYRLSDAAHRLVQRLVGAFAQLEQHFEIGVGINTGFIRDELVADIRVDERYHPMVPGDGISRYGAVVTDGWIMYDPDYVRGRGNRGRTLPPARFFTEPKILVTRTRNLALMRRVVATLDATAAFNLNRLSNIIARPGNSLHGLLAVLNSELMNWLFSTRYFDYEIKPVYLRALPIPQVNDPRLVAAAEEMLTLHRDLSTLALVQDRVAQERRIEALDRQIDDLVFELYRLPPEDIASVRAPLPGSPPSAQEALTAS
jgi:hypothetical protein